MRRRGALAAVALATAAVAASAVVAAASAASSVRQYRLVWLQFGDLHLPDVAQCQPCSGTPDYACLACCALCRRRLLLLIGCTTTTTTGYADFRRRRRRRRLCRRSPAGRLLVGGSGAARHRGGRQRTAASDVHAAAWCARPRRRLRPHRGWGQPDAQRPIEVVLSDGSAASPRVFTPLVASRSVCARPRQWAAATAPRRR